MNLQTSIFTRLRVLSIAAYDMFDFGKRAITGTSKRIPYAYPALRWVWYTLKKKRVKPALISRRYKQLRPIFKMHGVEMIPPSAPDESPAFKQLDYF